MRKKIAFIWLPALAFLLSACPAAGQIFDDHSMKLVETEKQSFSMKGGGNRGTSTNLTNTVASNNFDVTFYRCEWAIDPNIRFITGKVTSCFNITSPSDKIIFDLSDTLTVDSIIYHGSKLVYQRLSNDGLQLQFPAVLNTGQKDSVSIYYEGVPRAITGFAPFVQTTHNGVPVIWTLSEPYGAKEWWPCKNGLSDKADSIDISIRNPLAYHASSNGVRVQEAVADGMNVSTWKHRYPIASYLVALAVTNYVIINDTVLIGGKSMDLINYAYPENAADFSYQQPIAKQALSLYGRLFGDYPFAKEKYGFTQFALNGGMEHQTNSFISYPTVQLIEHETAHQWFGDKITCGSWQDIWLNEGFATYCQVLFNKYVDTVNYYPILVNFTRDITSAPDGSVYVSDTTDPNRIFSGRLSYDKGCFLLHMLRWKMGDSVFFHGMRRYFNDPLLQYNYARTTDFKRDMELESGQDLTTFFQKWFYGQGFPSYNCTWTQNKNNWAYVQINQTTSHPSVSFYDMPVQLKFMGAGKDTLITVNNQQNGESFWINPGFAADSMAVDPNYWILAKGRVVQKIPAASNISNDIKIYPNPAPVNLNISMLNPTATQISIRLYNASGQLVYKNEKSLSGRDELITVPVYRFAGGTYILSVSDGKNVNIRRAIVR